MRRHSFRLAALLTSTLVGVSLAACGSGDATESPAGATSAATTPAATMAAAPAATGRTIEIRAITDEKGNYFEPREIEARPGDVLRFVLVSGVHNVNFLPDSNAGKSGLPPASEYLQLPGQTIEIPVTFAPGDYYFQCDPHAALGMTGKLEVEEHDEIAAR